MMCLFALLAGCWGGKKKKGGKGETALCEFDQGGCDEGRVVFLYYEDIARWGGPLKGEEVAAGCFWDVMSV